MQLLKSALVLLPVIGLTAGMAGTAHADKLSYTYGDLSYVNVDGKTGPVHFNGDGIGAVGSLAVSENAFLSASYGHTKVEAARHASADFNNYQLGAGAHVPLQDNIDLVGSLSWVRIDADNFGASNGVNLGLGLRGMATEQIEWGTGVDYTRIDHSNGYSFNVAGRYHFTPELSAGVQLSTDEHADARTIAASLRYEMH